MRKKVSIHIGLALVLIFSLFSVYPLRVAAAPVVISPIDGRNDLDVSSPEYGLINGLYSKSVFKFGGIDTNSWISSAYLIFEGITEEWQLDIKNLKIAVAVDNWPATQVPAAVTPEKSINSSVPGIFSSIQPSGTDTSTYRINVSSLLTPSNIGTDGVLSLLMSTTSEYDGNIITPRLEINYAAAPVNTAPSLSGIGNKVVIEKDVFTFTATASDAEGDPLTYSLDSAPTGASINSMTGVFTWTPTEAQGPGTYTFIVRVSDGALTAEEQITVTVLEVNEAPVLAAIGDKTINEETLLTFTVIATDADLPANMLTYSLVGAPAGASINPVTGVFTWTPTEAQGPGSYTFTVRVSDGMLIDSEQITVTVNDVNAAPELAAIGNKTINEGALLTFTATATDLDSAILTYSLVNAPTGASINAMTGVFTWTPTEAQGPGSFTFEVVVSDGALTDEEEITVTVNEVNIAPILAAIGDKTVDEETLLTFTVVGTDTDLPANTLTYSLVNAPTGASINATTGVFTWTPTEAQGPGSYTFEVGVSDGVLIDSEEITVTVNEVNVAPVLAVIGNKTVNEGSQLKFTAIATDSDSAILTYSIDGAPTGASIHATTGVFTWTPTGAQSPGSYTFTVRVSDGMLTDEEVIKVDVNEIYTGGGISAPQSSANNTQGGISVPKPPANTVKVLVNGKLVDTRTVTNNEINGQTVIIVTVDEQKLMQQLKQEGKYAVITIPVDTDSNVVIGEFNGRILENLEKQQAIIVLQTNKSTYTIPAEQIDITTISSQLGANVALEDVKLKIEIAELLKNRLQIAEDAVNREGLTQVASPLNFKVSVEYDGRTVEILRFNAYVERRIAIPEGTDPNQITTGVVVEPDGSVRHVPTQVTKVGDRYYAVIHSLTNSTYTVVWNPLQFIDVENHWAKAAVNNIGSKMVVNGIENGMYHPDQDITRAEFAAIIVRGLGLSLSQGNSLFTDVGTTAWYRSTVQTAYEYGLINGFEDGTFRPNDKITREQAMLIVSKAMIITGLKESATNHSNVDVIRAFSDASTVSEWALDGVADSVSSGIISGRNHNLLVPKANITRAEVAMIIQRLLQTSDLINE
ncbi:putative Ig domain-containing protein [Paenibacillus segetis]|uniref:Uncharacterized protein n=1 Tax=Paenibacillus segetis TaxID=1325360 RepID=A0ABQ1Y5A9_9BACL|nr:putative Ig domain-containing protein [Paenibacillus segetis]GGH12871.1 hypothetical protein GCM10008013_05540 [Paenibacillus segetis]